MVATTGAMLSPFRVVNLCENVKDDSSELQIEDVLVQPLWQDHSFSPPLSLYRLQNGTTETDSVTAIYRDHCRATTKSLTALLVLMNLLCRSTTNDPTLNGCMKDLILCDDAVFPSAVLGNSVAILDETSEGAVLGTYSRNLFLPIHFKFPIFSGEKSLGDVRSMQYLQVASPSLKLSDAVFKQQGTRIFESINFVTGVCLYSEKILKASLSGFDGRMNVKKLLSAPATINELESITRCSSSLADVAAMIISRMRSEDYTQTINITIDIPSWHYYWSAVTKFKEDKCTANEALQWMAAVDLRHVQIAHVFRSAVQHELRRRGAAAKDVDIQISDMHNEVSTSIREALQRGKAPISDDLLRNLNTSNCLLWKEFYTLIPEKDKPKDIHSLGTLYYVFEVVRIALRKPGSTPALKPRLIVSIDDRMEHRIYFRAQNALKKLRALSRKDIPRPIFMEIYTARRLYVNNNKSRDLFFYHDPTPEISISTLTDSDEEEYRSESDDSEQRVAKPLDVIGHLYGLEQVRNLQIWLDEAGIQ